MTIYINGKYLAQRLTGVQRYAFEITKALVSLGAPIIVLIPPTVDVSTVNLPSHVLLSIGWFKNVHLWEQISIDNFLRGKRNYVLLNLCNMAPLMSKNQIVCIHDMAFYEQPNWFSWSFRKFYHFAIPRLVKRAKKVITVSEFSKNEVCDRLHCPEQLVSVVYNAPSSKFSFSKLEDIIFDKEDFFLFVGSHDPRKNLAILIKLFSLKEFSNQKLIIVGGKSNSFNMVALKESPNVIFKENCDDTELANYYSKARALINPSLYEGFGLPVIEAMAMGCPIILSDIEVFKEVAGSGAVYFSPHSLDSLRSTMNYFLSLEIEIRNKQIEKNFYRSENFSWHNSGNELLRVLNTL